MEQDLSSHSGCHKVGVQPAASTGDVDLDGEIVGALLERVRPSGPTRAAIVVGSIFSPIPVAEQAAGVRRMLAVTAHREPRGWGWDA